MNQQIKTFKIMVDDSFEDIFAYYLLNCHFSSIIFNKSNLTDEFYTKTELFTFYYYKLGNMVFLIIFGKDITFEDINTTKSTLKSFKDQFDNKGNYDTLENI